MSSFREDRGPETTDETMSEDREFETIEAILVSMKEEQSEHMWYKFSEAYIKYRQVVAEWMVDVAEYFNLHPTTTHAAVAYLDRLQPNEKFTRFEWQMLAICCLLISSKYNECEEHVPSLRRLEDITQQTISNSSVLNYELWALKRMGWKLTARVPSSFLASYLKLGVIFPSDRYNAQILAVGPEEEPLTIEELMEDKVMSLAGRCILDISFKPYQASEIACAILYHVRKSCGIEPVWPHQLTTMTFHDPKANKHVRRVLTMLETFEEEEPDARNSEVSLDEELLMATGNLCMSPVKTRELSPDDLFTPDQTNKENSKPISEVTELSPVSIANLDYA